jgi:hypothetical protein
MTIASKEGAILLAGFCRVKRANRIRDAVHRFRTLNRNNQDSDIFNHGDHGDNQPYQAPVIPVIPVVYFYVSMLLGPS